MALETKSSETKTSETKLRWQAQDGEDLTVIASAIQDGIVKVADMNFDQQGRYFTLILSRFRWEIGDYGKGERIGAALRIDSVLSIRLRGINRANPDAVAVLLSIEFVPENEPPGGTLRLIFAGGGEIALQVECIEVLLLDASPARGGRARPDHGLDKPANPDNVAS